MSFGFGLAVPRRGVSPAAPSYTYATWNPDDKDAGIALVDGNLTVNAPSSTPWISARATIGVETGDWYFELSTTWNNIFLGVGIAGGLPGYIGDGANGSVAWGINNGGYRSSNAGLVGGMPTGTLLAIALRRNTSQVVLYVDSTAVHTYDISSVDGQALYPMVSVYDAVSGTANFGQSAFVNSVPAGCNSGVYQ